MSLSLTYEQIEHIRDGLRTGGFDVPDDWDNETFAKLVTIIIDSLE